MTAGAAATRRAEIAARVADALLAGGLTAATLRPLARAAGTSDRMLLYYFRDKDDLLAAAVTIVAARMQAMLAAAAPDPVPPDDLLTRLLPLADAPAVRPFLALWLEMAGRAAQGDAFWRDMGRGIGADLSDWIAVRLDLPAGTDRPAAARAVLARIEGEVVLRAFGL